MQKHAPFHRIALEPYSPFLDFGDATLFVASAPLEDLPAPQFEVISVQPLSGGTLSPASLAGLDGFDSKIAARSRAAPT
jgi:hypothetical protein